MQYVNPRELNDLASLAARGGLGRGVATTDCVAEAPDQLMFIKGDSLILLRELPDVILASCEGVVGWVKKGEVEFELVGTSTSTSPSASGSGSPTPKSSIDIPLRDDLPRTVLTAPSPPPTYAQLPDDKTSGLEAPRASKRISGPFELESPQQSPNINQSDTHFFVQQQQPSQPLASQRPEDENLVDLKRESVTSIASSEAFGGIGGFMMGDNTSEEGHESLGDDMEELRDDVSPATASIETPTQSHSSPASPTVILPSNPHNFPLASPSHSDRSISGKSEEGNESDWDIYDDYARESMYGPRTRMSLAAKRASRKALPNRNSGDSVTNMGAFHAVRAALDGAQNSVGSIDAESTGSRERVAEDNNDPKTPKAEERNPILSPIEGGGFTGRSLATELRLRIQRERERELVPPESGEKLVFTPPTKLEETPQLPSRPNKDSPTSEGSPVEPVQPILRVITVDDPTSPVSPVNAPDQDGLSSRTTSEMDHSRVWSDESESTVQLETPQARESVTFTAPQSVNMKANVSEESTGLMASPMPLEETPRLAEPLEVPSPTIEPASPIDDRSLTSPIGINHLPQPPNWSPSLAAPQPPHLAWSPGSPASPHSIAATRQAVEAVRATPEGKRPRGLTLVGKMEADLSAAKGPVPISFLIGGPGYETPKMSIGLGFPSGRRSPATPEARAMSPIMAMPPPMPDGIHDIRSSPSRFPTPTRSVTSPIPAPPSVLVDTAAGPRPGFLAARPRSRSFSATVARAVGKKKESALVIDTSVAPVPALPSPAASTASKRSIFSRKASTPALRSKDTPPVSTYGSSTSLSSNLLPTSSTPSSVPPSARSSSFSFTSKQPKQPRKSSQRILPSPVSHKDFEDTVNAGGMDFEIVQPKKLSSAPPSPASPLSMQLSIHDTATLNTASSSNTLSSRILHATDEWGFIKELSTVPEIFSSRAAPGDHRAVEQKWLSIIATPVPSGGPPKKVKKLVLESGIPASLRGRVWAWFMAPSLSARVPGLYDELCGHDKPSVSDNRIDRDVATLWSDHSIFHSPSAPGRTDLRALLRAYSNFAPSGYSTPMCHLAGTLLIHCVAEDAFWLLSGLVNTALKEYYTRDGIGLKVDAGAFEGVLKGSEKELATLFKDLNIRASEFVGRWYKQLFVRCLPWPTALRVIDAVVSEGPRFLLITSLTILTLSKDRLLALPRNKAAVLGYLNDLPQDSLLLPENFMRASEKVRFRQEDWKKLRSAVEKELGLV